LFSVIYWLPGLAGMLLIMFGWFVPAAALLGTLICFQWPLMLAAAHMARGNRQRLREERRAFLLPSFARR
jgi:hypothetical protein